MPLKRTYDSQDEIPESLRDHYTEQDGKWQLDAEPSQGEMHAENVRRALAARDNEKAERERLRLELDNLKSGLDGVDLSRIDELKDFQRQKEELEHQALIAEKKYEEAAEKKHERRIAELMRNVENLQKQLQERAEIHDALRQKYAKSRLTDALSEEFRVQNTDPKKLPFLLAIAERMWELNEEDEPTPIDFVDGGKTKITAVGADGNTLSMKEHIKSLLAENPWAVLESTGSRAHHQMTASTQNGTYVIPANEAQDIRRYEAHKAAAEKAGLDWTIADVPA